MSGAGAPRPGWVAPALAEEFPALGLRRLPVAAAPGRSSPAGRARLRRLSDRYTGARAITLRREPVPWAYRVFFRQIGIDPDERRTPVEQAVLDRMLHGGFRARNLVDDALLVATVETGVALVALDADRLEGDVGLRLAHAGERLGGEGPRPLSAGQIVIADAARSVAVLFGDVAEGRGVTPASRRLLLAAVQVEGVDPATAEEALWIAADLLAGGS